jgi:deoxyadenosine/deoxycytidine kinase
VSAKLISIIGPAAAGKTTLANYLGGELPASVLHEDYAGNPFLAEAFTGFEEMALPSQLYFLVTRCKQLSVATWPAEGTVVTDYGFCQDRLYAEIKLTDDDRLFYEHVTRQIEYLVQQPSVIIHLDAPVELLMERITDRGRVFEADYSEKFLQRVRDAHFDIPLPGRCERIVVNCAETDLRDPAERVKLIRTLREYL